MIDFYSNLLFQISGGHVIVTMEHTINGKPKILNECTLPITAKRCVDKIITDLSVFEITKDHILRLVELAEGVTVEDVKKATGCPFIISDHIKYFK